MFMFFGKKKNPHDTGCFVCHVIVTVLLFVTTLAALMEVLASHYVILKGAREATMIFGTSAGSLSLIAFAITITFWVKSFKACMSGCEACGINGKK